MRGLLLLAIAGTLSLSANATNWVYVDYTALAERYVDTDSISKEGDYRTVFYKDMYFEEQVTLRAKTYNEVTTFAKYDCRSKPKKFTILSFVYRKDNKTVESVNTERFNEWSILYPDTIGEATADFVCSY